MSPVEVGLSCWSILTVGFVALYAVLGVPAGGWRVRFTGWPLTIPIAVGFVWAVVVLVRGVVGA